MVTFLRSSLIALCAVAAGVMVYHVLLWAGDSWKRRVVWMGVLLPLVTPSIVGGYVYSQLSLDLVHYPRVNVLVYGLVMVGRLMSVAVLILYFSPRSPISREGLYCGVLAGGSANGGLDVTGRLQELFKGFGLWIRGPVIVKCLAFAATFVIAFGEFEIASLMGIGSWTVWLFDAQAGGVAMGESVVYAIWPVFGVMLVIGPLGVVLIGSGRDMQDKVRLDVRIRPMVVACGIVILLTAAVGVTVYPGLVIVSQAFASGGGWSVIENLRSPVMVSVGFALAGAAISFIIARQLIGYGQSGGRRRVLSVAIVTAGVCLPGLFGSLLVGLMVLLGFNGLTALDGLRDSAIPLIVALTMVVLPLAVLLRLVAGAMCSRSSVYLAGVLQDSSKRKLRRGGGELVWRLKVQPGVWMGFLLFLIGYFDISASAILSPAGQTPASVLLYNLMHYGQNSVLAAMLLAVIAAGGVVLVTGQGFGRVLSQTGAIHG